MNDWWQCYVCGILHPWKQPLASQRCSLSTRGWWSVKTEAPVAFLSGAGVGAGIWQATGSLGSFLWPLSFPGFIVLPVRSWLIIIRGREKTVGPQHGIWQNLGSTALLISQLKMPGTRELESRGWRGCSLFLCMCSLQNHWVTLEILVVLHLLKFRSD